MTAVKWFIRITATILVVTAISVAAIGIIIGTERGTRWALGFAADLAPGQLVVTEPTGTLLGGLRLASLEWRNDSTALQAEQVLVNMDLWPLLSRRIDVRRFDAGIFRLQLGDRAEEDTASTPVDVSLPVAITIASARIDEISIVRGDSEYAFSGTAFAASFAGSRLDVPEFVTSAFGLDIDAAGRIRLAGTLPLRLDGSWRQSGDRPPGLAGSLELRGDLNELIVAHQLTAPFSVDSRGTVRVAGGDPVLDIENRWDRVAWSFDDRLLEATGGSLGLRGTPDALTVALETEVRFADYPPTRIALDGVTDLAALEIERLVAENPWGTAELSGSVTREPSVTAEVDFRLARVDPSHFVADLTGELAAQGSASLRIDDKGVTIGVRGDNIAGTVNQQFVVASTSFEYTPDLLDVQYAELRLGANLLRATGRISETIALDAVLELNALDELVPEASGAAKATLSLRDRRTAPTGQIEVSGAQLAYGRFRSDEFRLAIGGSIADHAIDATLVRDGNRVDVVATGGYAAEAWTGMIDSLALHSITVGRWDTRQAAGIAASRDSFVVDNLCLVGSADGTVACAAIDHRPGSASEFAITVEGLPVAALPFDPPPGVSVAGSIAAEAQGRLDDGVLNAQATVRADGAALTAEYEGEQARVELDLSVGTVTVADNSLESALTIRFGGEAGAIDGSLTAADVFDAASAIGGEVDVSIRDAGLFSVFAPSVTNPRGSVDGRLEISGSRAQPAVLGSIQLRDGAFSVRPAGIDVRDLNLRAERSVPGQLELSGSARSGEGSVVLVGNTFFGTDSGIRSEVSIEGDDFELVRLPDLRLTASPDIDIVFDEQAAVVSGRLTVPTAAITVKTIPESAARVSPDATVHVAGATEFRPGRQIDIDVDTVLGEGVRFDGFGLTTGLTGAVRIQGGSQRPYLGFGQLDLREGRYKAYGQELTIERGQLIFNGPLNSPNLDVRATRRVDDVVAGIQVTGQPTRLRSEVFSEPPLSDAETLAYLLTGRPLSGATTASDGDLLNKAAFALGMSQAGSVVSQIGGTLGLETLSVEGGAEAGRIVAGKRIGGRLLVEYGYGFIDKLGTLMLRYQINNRLVLESRTGTVSNLDIVYSVKKQ